MLGSQPKRTVDAECNSLDARVRQAVVLLDTLVERGEVLIGMPKEQLAKRVS